MIKQMVYLLLFCFLNVYLFLTPLGLCFCMGFSLVTVCGLLIAVASLVVEYGLYGTWTSGVVAPRL